MQAQQKRRYPNFRPIETKPLPAAWQGLSPPAEPERSGRWFWIVLGVVLVFGSVIGGSYWLSQRGQAPVATVRASPPPTAVKPAPAPVVLPPAPPEPQLAVGLPPLSTTTGSVAAQPPAPGPSQSPQLAVGLRPINGEPPPDALAPEPAAEAPPASEPLPSPVPSANPPHRKAATHPPSPVANPDQPSGFVKF